MTKHTSLSRWEWRNFNKDFQEAEAKIQNHRLGNLQNIEDIYFLSPSKNHNIKIRKNTLEIKTLQAVNKYGLEKWSPAEKYTFPVSADMLGELFSNCGVCPIGFEREEYTMKQLFHEVVKPNQFLKTVKTKKHRSIYVINQCIVEIALLNIAGLQIKSICVEYTEPDTVIRTVEEIGLKKFRNVNYLSVLNRVVQLSDIRKKLKCSIPG